MPGTGNCCRLAWFTAVTISLCLVDVALTGIPRSGRSGCPEIMNSGVKLCLITICTVGKEFQIFVLSNVGCFRKQGL